MTALPISASPRLQTVSIYVAYGAAGIYWGAFSAALPAFQTITGLGNATFGWLMTLTTVGGIIAMQMLGRVLHRVQAVAIPYALVAFAAGMVIMGMATGPLVFGLSLLVAGAASGALDIALNMRVARIENDLNVRLFNRVHALFPFAMLVTSILVGIFRQWGATPAIIMPTAALFLLAAACLEWQAGKHQQPEPGLAKGSGRVRIGHLLVLLGALAAIGALVESGANTWSAIFVEGELGAGPAIAGLAAASMTLGLTIGRLIAHQIEHSIPDMVIIRISALVTLPAFVLLAVADQPVLALLGFFVAGLGTGPIAPAVYRSVTQRFPEAERGRALALATGVAYAGFLAAPPAMGVMIEGFGWPAMWLTLCIFAIIASALSTRIPPLKTS